jgi:hypothetical protein
LNNPTPVLCDRVKFAAIGGGIEAAISMTAE